MDKEMCLEINISADYIAPQFICLPLVVLRACPMLKNWYYQNYIMPVVRLDGVNSLTCDISDAVTYGAGANMYGKVMRISNVNQALCEQIKDIVPVLVSDIGKRYYCVIFLDFYYLKCAPKYYQKEHFFHEMLVHGYDNTRESFQCYGYFSRAYRQVEISYEELRQAFGNTVLNMGKAGGWGEYMLIIMRIFDHEEEAPYSGECFLKKLAAYVSGKAEEEFQYENLMYLKPSESSASAMGVKVTEIFEKYISMLRAALKKNGEDWQFESQLTAFNIYKNYHRDISERLKYYAEFYKMQKVFAECISDYYSKVVRGSEEIRMLYIKLICMTVQQLQADKVLERMAECLRKIKENEEKILGKFLEIARAYDTDTQ